MGSRYVSFILGDGRYGIPVDQVVQILRHENVLDIPKAPRFVVGVVNLSGVIVPVVDLRERFGIARSQDRKKERIVVTTQAGRTCGFLVDEVRELVEFEEGDIRKDEGTERGARPEFISAMAKRGDALVLFLDLQRVLSTAEDKP
jgi:purine-binding chemotaxis protein CheW